VFLGIPIERYFRRDEIKKKEVGTYLLNESSKKIFKIYTREEIIEQYKKSIDNKE